MKRAMTSAGLLVLMGAAQGAFAVTADPGPATCAGLAELGSPQSAITAAVWHDATDPLGAHCEITGDIDRRVGVNGQSYGIKFHLRLPVPWNGRFFFEAQGGNDGVLGLGVGLLRNALPPFNAQVGANALVQGYATVSTDAGHDNSTNTVPNAGNAAAFGLDPQARIDYGYRALDVVTTRSKQLIEVFYGGKPHHSYIMGCSNGGREAMVAADRFPDYFDGVVAGDPGFNLPKAALGEIWNNQAYASLATTQDTGSNPYLNGNPLLAPTFSPADLNLVATAVLQKCDALDGLVDGIVDNAPACRVHLSSLECSRSETGSCLTARQVAVLKKVVAGAHTSTGRRIYSGFPVDPGIGAPGWRQWMLGSSTTTNDAFNASFASSHAYIFLTPPVQGPNPFGYEMHFNFDTDSRLIYATSGPYTQSSIEFMSATTHLRRFAKRGGKMIIYHGNSDPVFSVKESIGWLREAQSRTRGEDGRGEEFVRLFRVPGMNHCSGGPATDSFDALTPVVNWVEKGIAPDRIIATARSAAVNPASPWPGRTRPLCPYPKQARYNGSGSIEDAANFSCRSVDEDERDDDDEHHGE